MRDTLRCVVLVAALVVGMACGDSSGPGALSVSGTYTGSISATGFPAGTLTLSLVQAGTSVSGTWSTSLGTSGSGSGSVSGATLSFTLTQTSPCAGSFTGNATIENAGSRLSGSFSGSDCNGSGSGTFLVNRP